mmetsp:Transcript_8043/g.27324  ORF Transcript_8043/g.27324 Transcript_8043/m.27324 type:complete len:328 (-) Transcript_8043:606-1589(-)
MRGARTESISAVPGAASAAQSVAISHRARATSDRPGQEGGVSVRGLQSQTRCGRTGSPNAGRLWEAWRSGGPGSGAKAASMWLRVRARSATWRRRAKSSSKTAAFTSRRWLISSHCSRMDASRLRRTRRSSSTSTAGGARGTARSGADSWATAGAALRRCFSLLVFLLRASRASVLASMDCPTRCGCRRRVASSAGSTTKRTSFSCAFLKKCDVWQCSRTLKEATPLRIVASPSTSTVGTRGSSGGTSTSSPSGDDANTRRTRRGSVGHVASARALSVPPSPSDVLGPSQPPPAPASTWSHAVSLIKYLDEADVLVFLRSWELSMIK